MRLRLVHHFLLLAAPAALALAPGAASAADVDCDIPGPACNVNFPDTAIGSQSTKSVKLTMGPDHTTPTITIAGAPGEFATDHDTCSGTALASGATCTFDVVYSPTGVTSHASSGTLEINTDVMALFLTGGLSGQALGSAPPPAPAVSSVSPSSGTEGQFNTVTLTGSDFGTSGADLASVLVDCGVYGATGGTHRTWISPTELTVRVPQRPAGAVCTFTVTTTSGGASVASTATYTYVAAPPAPTITSVAPTSGAANTAATVTLAGSNFGASSASLTGVGLDCGGAGTHAGTNVAWISPTALTVDVPALSAGATCQFTVTAAGQTSALSAATYTYVAPAPAITSVSPTEGTAGQSATVILTGTNFGSSSADLTGVTFDCGAAGTKTATNLIWISSTLLSVTVPALAADTCTFKVTAQGQTSAASAQSYTYVALPSVSAVTPQSADVGSSAIVTLTGANFGAVASALERIDLDCGDQGTSAGVNATWLSATQATVQIPKINVSTTICRFKVTVSGRTSALSTATFTFLAVPQVSPPKPDVPAVPVPGFTITGTDGSSISSGSMSSSGQGAVRSVNGVPTYILNTPARSNRPTMVTADITAGSQSGQPTTSTPTVVPIGDVRQTVSVRTTLKLSMDITNPDLGQPFVSDLISALASATGVPRDRFTVVSVDSVATSSRASRAAADPAPCTAQTASGTRCRVTWTLPKLPVGSWNLTLIYGGLQVPVSVVSQPALTVAAPKSRCLRLRASGAVPRAKVAKGTKSALAVVKLTGSALRCSGKAGTTNRGVTGKARVVSTDAAKPASVRRGLRKLARGDYLLVWMAGGNQTPSDPQYTYVKVR